MVVVNISRLRGSLSVLALKSTSKKVNYARKALCDEIIKDTDEFVPYDTGKLSHNVTTSNNNKNILYTADYAEYVYNMPESNNFNRSVHKNATSNWFEASMTINRDKWLSNFKERISGK